MNHVDGQIEALVDGALGETERTAVLGHIAGCQTCREALTAAQAIPRLLSPAADPPAPSGLAGEVVARVRSKRRRSERAPSVLVLAAALAAAAALTGGALALAGMAGSAHPAMALARFTDSGAVAAQSSRPDEGAQGGGVVPAASAPPKPRPSTSATPPTTSALAGATVPPTQRPSPTPTPPPPPSPTATPEPTPTITPIDVDPVTVTVDQAPVDAGGVGSSPIQTGE